MNTVVIIMVTITFVWCVVDIIKSIKNEIDKRK